MFCEECGNKLGKEDRFCENCGTPVPMENTNILQINSVGKDDFSNWNTVFTSSDWQSVWKETTKEKCSEVGLILTKSEILCKQLSCSKANLDDLLKEYVVSANSRGVSYYLLDLSNNYVNSDSDSNVSNVIDIISKVCEIFAPKYLFILGNEEVVGVKTWKNESSDSDADVTSDFAYSVLDTTSPWDGVKYYLDSALRVGRIPTWTGESFSQFSKYFENAKNNIGSFSKINPYGLSALVWRKETDDEFSVVSSNKVDVSPSVTQHNVDGRIPKESNLFLFNLHGSAQTEYWYGQDGSDYPEAFSPENISHLISPNFIGVEACYGAMYEKNKDSSSSNVLSALSNKTLALLGSSRIAYGTSCPPGSCADIVIGEFIKQIAKGETAGDAHIAGLKQLSKTSMDDSDIKTLCEFGLFGDPSACTGNNKNISSQKSFVFASQMGKTGAKSNTSGLHISVPDVHAAVRLSLAIVDSKIAEQINIHVYDSYENMKGIAPKIYMDSNTKMYQSVYEDSFKNIVKVYFDSFGHIKKELTSK